MTTATGTPIKNAGILLHISREKEEIHYFHIERSLNVNVK